jgi:hypothetical protein
MARKISGRRQVLVDLGTLMALVGVILRGIGARGLAGGVVKDALRAPR